MQVICLEDAALYELIDQVVDRLKEKKADKNERWIHDEEAMKLLKVSSRTSMQKLRDTGKIRFSQPTRKTILYDRESILEYLNKNARETF